MTHADYLELLAGDALGGLDASEHDQLRSHAATCPDCAADAARLDEVMVDLALAAPMRQPSAGLQARILDAIAAETRASERPATAVVAESTSPAPERGRTMERAAAGRPWWSWLQRPAVSFAAVGLALVLAVSSLVLGARTTGLQDQLATRNAALAVLADPNHVQAPLEPEDGNTAAVAMAVYLPHSSTAYVMATGLAPTPSGEVYQLWFADAAGVHALGTYQYDGQGPFVAPFGVDLTTSAAVMVTLEPTGGSKGEPGPQVVFGELPGGTT